MAENKKPVDVWPFHEMLLHAFEDGDEDQEELDTKTLFWVIRHTKIPVGHDQIIKRLRVLFEGLEYDELEEVIAHVLEQKRLAEEKAAKKVTEIIGKEIVADSVAAATQVFQGVNQ